MKSNQYHHGALREALLAAAETILKRDGLPALTLRATAREAGVSHAAPAHHFPDLASLLSELAARGFEKLFQALEKTKANPHSTNIDLGRTYVKFAKDNSAIFQLMSDPGRLDSKNTALQAGRQKSLQVLAGSRSVSLEKPTLEELGAITANWALIHGYALLMLTGRLKTLLKLAPQGTTEMDLLDAALESMKRP